MDEAIKVENLSKEYNNFRLDNLSFSVPKGCVMGLIGENGAGKSTAIKAMLNIIKNDGGTVQMLGMDMKDHEQEIKEQIGVVWDENHFHSYLNLKQVEKIMGRIYHSWDKDAFYGYARQFSLSAEKKIKEYSRGMTMKLAIAAALAHHPRLLILDEATGGLDPAVREEILDIFFDFIQDGEHSILMSTHITSDLDKIADYITMIRQGKLVFSEEKDQMLDNMGVWKCAKGDPERYEDIQVVGSRHSEFGMHVLIREKENARLRHPELVIDQTNIEEIMLFYVRGN